MNILIYIFLFIIIIYLFFITSENFFVNTSIKFGNIPQECTVSGYLETTISGKCNGIVQSLVVTSCKINSAGKYDFQLINNKLHCDPLTCLSKNSKIATDANGNYLLNSQGDPYCISCSNGSKMFVDANGNNNCASCTNGVLSLNSTGDVLLDSNSNPICIPYCNSNYTYNNINNICYPANMNTCPVGFILNNGICELQNTVTCAKGTMNKDFLCDISNCPVGYTMDASNNCISNCPSGYIYNSTTSNCTAICPNGFSSYTDPTTKSIVCAPQRKCNAGYVLVKNLCTQVCPPDQIPILDSSGNPKLDANGNYTCSSTCPSGTVFVNNQCLSTTCLSGYVPYIDPVTNNLYCRTYCPAGQIYNLKNNTCTTTIACPTHLVKTSDSSGNTICVCPPNFTTATDSSGNISCSQICPQGLNTTVESNGTPVCTGACVNGYKLQVDSNNNVLCVPQNCNVDEYLNNNNVCQKICLANYTYNTTTKTCNPLYCPNNLNMIPDTTNPNNTSLVTYNKCYPVCGNNLVYDITSNLCIPDINNPPCPINYSKDVPNQQCKLMNTNLIPQNTISGVVQTIAY
jgi:hypothetical protein